MPCVLYLDPLENYNWSEIADLHHLNLPVSLMFCHKCSKSTKISYSSFFCFFLRKPLRWFYFWVVFFPLRVIVKSTKTDGESIRISPP